MKYQGSFIQPTDGDVSLYTRNGYKNRIEYLESLADEYGEMVFTAAELLGPNEDFDGLITTCEDYCDSVMNADYLL